MVEKLAALTHRWRHAVVAAEVLLAAGCGYFGWSAVVSETASAVTPVHHAVAPSPAAADGRALPIAAAKQAAPKRTLQAPDLTADWLSRLNADDYDLYRGQWQTLQVLMSGVRQYLEQRVVPRLLGH